MTNLINLNNFLNHAIGFEDVFNRLSSLHTYNTGFPYYNIKKKGSDKYSLEMTLAGYKKSDIDVEISEGIITITGKAGKEEKEDYVIKEWLRELLRVSYNWLTMWKRKVLPWKTGFLKSNWNTVHQTIKNLRK